MAELIWIPFSPFSKRAKWALDISGVSCRLTSFPVSITYLGELPLRWRLGRLKGRLTASILIPQGTGPKGAIDDSVDIAKWADANGSSPGLLFPPGAEETITKLLQDANMMTSYLRRNLALGVIADPALGRALLPPLPPLVLKLLGWLVDRQFRAVAQKMVTKYTEDAAVTEEKARGLLQSISDALAASGSGYLLPSGFSFADIAWVITLDTIAPGDPFAPPPPPTTTTPTVTAGEGATNIAGEGQAANGLSGGSASSNAKRGQPLQHPTMAVPKLRAVMEPFPSLVKWKNEVLARHMPQILNP